VDSFLQDLRYAFRTLRKSPAFTLIAVLCLSLGIATNTTLFSCFNAIVLRPFPFEDPERLVALWDRNPKNNNRTSISYPNFQDWREQTKSFSDIAGYSGRSIAITEGEEPARLDGMIVTANLFPMLGVRPQIGRLFRPDEDKAGAPGAVLLSDGVWRRMYAGDSAVVGRTISINNLPYTVVGVMPPRFRFPRRSEIWIPMAPISSNDKREARSVLMIGRLKPNVAVGQADRDLAEVSKRLNQQYAPGGTEWVGTARELRKDFLPDDIKLITTTMMGAVMFVLLIACANVANLMLTRAAGRQREIAIRAAIGAGRGRIVRQLLTEAVILALIAGVVAIPLSWEGLRLIYSAIPAEDPIPYYMEFSLDRATLVYTAVVSLLAGMAFGLAPALQAASGRLHEALKDGARGVGGSIARNRVRSILVVAEVALSLVLLVGASLFVRSFVALQGRQVGFDTSPIMTMRFFLPGTRYDSVLARAHAVEEVLQRVQALPGVQSATISNLVPVGGNGGSGGRVIIEGKPVEKEKEPFFLWTGVAGKWTETFGVTMLSGRTFTEAELRDSAAVAVIDKSMATRFWPKADPIGQRFRMVGDSSQTWISVIGVASDMRLNGLDDNDKPPPSAFLPYRFLPARNNGLMVRARGNATSVTTAVRAAIRATDAAIPVFNVATMEKVRELSFWQYGLFGAMFGAFGAIALFLAAIGVYGVISYGVSQRTREIGVRVALGAQRRNVIGLVVRQGMVLAAVGIAVGLVGAFGVTRVVSSLLAGVSATDPLSFGGVAFFLGGMAFLASYIPARRATYVDPIVALRNE
jgi:putative ABC transport system permease protein